MTSVKFLSIDPSITCTALSILQHIDGDTFELLHKTSLNIKSKYVDRFKKKMDMYELFKYWLDLNGENISFAVFENYSYGSSGHLADLGELNGLYKQYLYNRSIPFETMAPASVKKVIAGDGRASKEEVAAALNKFLINFDTITFNNTDESDSAAIGIAYAINMLNHLKK